MIQVFKCDHCSHLRQDAEEMRIHEVKCSFNEINKKCFTCTHSWDSGHDYSIPECEKHLSTIDGHEKGNCVGWKADA